MTRAIDRKLRSEQSAAGLFLSPSIDVCLLDCRGSWDLSGEQAVLRLRGLLSTHDPSSSSSSSSRTPALQHRRLSQARKLLSGFSSNVIQVAFSNTSSVCPNSSTSGDWAAIPNFGHLVSDNWICSNPAAPPKVSLMKFYTAMILIELGAEARPVNLSSMPISQQHAGVFSADMPSMRGVHADAWVCAKQ